MTDNKVVQFNKRSVFISALPLTERNARLIEQINGVAATPATPEMDADPRNPNVKDFKEAAE